MYCGRLIQLTLAKCLKIVTIVLIAIIFARKSAVGGKRQIKQRQPDEEVIIQQICKPYRGTLSHVFPIGSHNYRILLSVEGVNVGKRFALSNARTIHVSPDANLLNYLNMNSTHKTINLRCQGLITVRRLLLDSIDFSVIVWRTIKNGWIKIETHKQRDI